MACFGTVCTGCRCLRAVVFFIPVAAQLAFDVYVSAFGQSGSATMDEKPDTAAPLPDRKLNAATRVASNLRAKWLRRDTAIQECGSGVAQLPRD